MNDVIILVINFLAFGPDGPYVILMMYDCAGRT